jgi:hypothetical protein
MADWGRQEGGASLFIAGLTTPTHRRPVRVCLGGACAQVFHQQLEVAVEQLEVARSGSLISACSSPAIAHVAPNS